MLRTLLSFVALLCATVAAHAQGPGTVDGSVTVGGVAVKLTDVYAAEVREIPELAFAGEPVTLRLVLTDRKLPADDRDAEATLRWLGGRAALRGLLFELNLAGTYVMHAYGFAGQPLPSFNGNPQSTSLAVKSFRRTGNRIEAHLVGNGHNSAFPEFNFPAFDLRIEAEVRPARAVPAPLEGRAARDSAPAVALAKVLAARARNDVAGIRAGLVHGADLTADDLAQLPPLRATPASVMATLTKAYVWDDHAQLLFTEDGGTTSVPMTRLSDGWKQD